MILYERTHPYLRPYVFERSISVFLRKIMDFFCWKIEKNMWFWHIWVHNMEAIFQISHLMILYESTHPHLRAHVFEFPISEFLTKKIDFFCWTFKKNPQFWHIWVHNFDSVHQNRHMMVLYASRHPQSEAYVFRFSNSWFVTKILDFFCWKNKKTPRFWQILVHNCTGIHQINMKCCIDVLHDAYNNCPMTLRYKMTDQWQFCC